MAVNIELLATEHPNMRSVELDSMSPLEIIALMNAEDASVAHSVSQELDVIAHAVERTANALRRGGRLIYVGSGTSGRMGMLDASECQPTFDVSANQIFALMAGGNSAFARAQEGVEDDLEAGRKAVQEVMVGESDAVVCISASGRTPYALGALAAAKELGAYTVGLSCNKNALLSKDADTAIEIDSGPEVLTGSTRLKAGSVQKMVLNMISTGSMIMIGKVYKNYMVDMAASNEKLDARALGILKEVLHISGETATSLLESAHNSVKIAIVMHRLGLTFDEAIGRLNESSGSVRSALAGT